MLNIPLQLVTYKAVLVSVVGGRNNNKRFILFISFNIM
jgi:hypothetical protein